MCLLLFKLHYDYLGGIPPSLFLLHFLVKGVLNRSRLCRLNKYSHYYMSNFLLPSRRQYDGLPKNKPSLLRFYL